jgi:hypothetical protein
MAAAAAGSLVQGVTGAVGGFMGAKEQGKGAQQARGIYEAQAGKYDPYVKAGTDALSSYQAALTGRPNESFQQWMNSPMVQWQLQQAQQGTQGTAAARGSLMSGATLKALQGQAQGIQGQAYGNYLNALQGLASQGLSATGGQTAAASGQANSTQDVYNARALRWTMPAQAISGAAGQYSMGQGFAGGNA